MNDYTRKRASGGFSLVEVMLVIAIIAILAGSTMLVISRGGDNAEATVILSDLDAAKNALLAYSMGHRTRASDRLGEFETANSLTIMGSLDNYMSAQVVTSGSSSKGRFDKIDVDITPNGKIRIGFVGFSASKGVVKALERKISASQSSVSYVVSSDMGNCTIWLDVR